MPEDFCMCATFRCQMRKKCYRATAIPVTWQSWSKWEPKGKKCDGFIKSSATNRTAVGVK